MTGSDICKKINEMKKVFCKEQKRERVNTDGREYNEALECIVRHMPNMTSFEMTLLSRFSSKETCRIAQELLHKGIPDKYCFSKEKPLENGNVKTASITLSFNSGESCFYSEIKTLLPKMHPQIYCSRSLTVDFTNLKEFEKLLKSLQSGEDPIIGWDYGKRGEASPIYLSMAENLILPSGDLLSKQEVMDLIENYQDLFADAMAAHDLVSTLLKTYDEDPVIHAAEQIAVIYQIGESDHDAVLMDAMKLSMAALSAMEEERGEFSCSIYDVIDIALENENEKQYLIHEGEGDMSCSYVADLEYNDVALYYEEELEAV